MVAAAKGDAAGALGQLDHTNLFPGGVVDIELALREVYIAGRIRHHARAAARDKWRHAEAFESGQREADKRGNFVA